MTKSAEGRITRRSPTLRVDDCLVRAFGRRVFLSLFQELDHFDHLRAGVEVFAKVKLTEVDAVHYTLLFIVLVIDGLRLALALGTTRRLSLVDTAELGVRIFILVILWTLYTYES